MKITTYITYYTLKKSVVYVLYSIYLELILLLLNWSLFLFDSQDNMHNEPLHPNLICAINVLILYIVIFQFTIYLHVCFW